MVRSIQEVLESEPDIKYEFDHGYDGQVVEEKIQSFKPDMVIVDVLMPHVNGFQVCKNIKADKQAESIKIIVISSLMSRSQKENALSWGADYFLAKPFDGHVLKTQVKKLLLPAEKL
ncbi:MAG: DNA-binding response OmpR family regulator [Candidatus Omnitrophota bacterium]|jgi:DNA-binding response OmpR family regulator